MATRRSSLLGMGSMLALAGVPASTLFAQVKTPTIDGYDPVAYFTEQQAVQGKPTISFDWDHKRYLFANTKHRDLFAANPDRYEPQFNGMCAGAVSAGYKSKANPKVWRIIDGKLYVFSRPEHSEEAYSKTAALAQSKWKDVK